MSDIASGKLIFSKGKGGKPNWRVEGPSKKGKVGNPLSCPPDNIDPAIVREKPQSVAVDYEFGERGEVIKVRRKGEKWAAPAPQQVPQVSPKSGDFNNPYNFIPAIPTKPCAGLGQGAPVGHHAYFDGHYSGRIKISVEAKTPLLLLDTRTPDYNNDHPTFSIRTDAAGRPVLSPTALKGPLRSAYESVTNSRMGVFKSEDRLGRRMSPDDALAMVPARVSASGDKLELLLGSELTKASDWKSSAPVPAGKRWKPRNGIMYAAWLPQYPYRGSRAERSLSPVGGSTIEHEQEVACIITKIAYGQDRQGDPIFHYWRVDKIAPTSNKHQLKQLDLNRFIPAGGSGKHRVVPGTSRYIEGYVCITNR
ncbi:MAG TPA: hypothetical protein ENJ90_03175, partial [Devosia sp.]|nr:hypothetical protein [Devosia sp.]